MKSSSNQPAVEDLYLFVSMDLVNSTKYKYHFGNGWPDVFNKFYTFIAEALEESDLEFKSWKHIGDEVLFYLNIQTQEDLLEGISYARTMIDSITNKLMCMSHSEYANMLSLKGTAWLTKVEPSSTKAHLHPRNIRITPSSITGPDFLGPEIDIGFRLTNYSSKLRLIVSAELAYVIWLIFQANSIAKDGHKTIFACSPSNFRIVSYEQLKGVWYDRHYPILWFENDWTQIIDKFDYDEKFNSPIIKNLIETNNQCTEPLEKVSKVFSSLPGEGQREKDIFNKLKTKFYKKNEKTTSSKTSSIWCSAICYDQAGVYLLADKSTIKGEQTRWTFGGHFLEEELSPSTFLKKHYKKTYGFKLSPSTTPLNIDIKQKNGLVDLYYLSEITYKPSRNVLNQFNHFLIEWKDIHKFDSSILDEHHYAILQKVISHLGEQFIKTEVS